MKTHIKISKNGETVNTVHRAMQQGPLSGILQAYKDQTIQRLENEEELPFQLKTENRSGLPYRLKSGIEQLSGFSMDDVRVHYNSGRPAQLQALAYTQGNDIHIAPGQERHLPHEAWHVVQQKQGRVNPTTQLKGIHINDSISLEQEADTMGDRALKTNSIDKRPSAFLQTKRANNVTQMVRTYVIEDRNFMGKAKVTHLTTDAMLVNFRQFLKEESDVVIDSFYREYVSNSSVYNHFTRKERIHAIMSCNFFKKPDSAKKPANNPEGPKSPEGPSLPPVDNLQEDHFDIALDQNETLILVSHASKPLLFFNPVFGGYAPEQLAKRLFKKGIIPRGYSGLIYIDGCNTANGKTDYTDGTSFISRFKEEMQNTFSTFQLGSFKVKGNLGEAHTIRERDNINRGKEQITFTKETISQLEERLVESCTKNERPKPDSKKIKYANWAKMMKEMRNQTEKGIKTSFVGKIATYTI